MATHALSNLQGNAFRDENRAGQAAPVRLRRSRGFFREGDVVYVSTGAGLNGAKAAVLGIALEAACVLCVIGAWLLWRIVH